MSTFVDSPLRGFLMSAKADNRIEQPQISIWGKDRVTSINYSKDSTYGDIIARFDMNANDTGSFG